MGYAKQETIKKQKKLVSKSQRNIRKVLVNIFKIILVVFVAVIIAGAGAVFGMMKGILDNAPDVDDINIMPKGYKSVVYDQDGNIDWEFTTSGSNREYVYYDEIPEQVVNAFVAIEDERFWSHNGIDVKGILRAGFKGIANGGHFDEGASTLTQQLIKNQVFNVGLDEVTFMDRLERKIQEQYLALELEKKYTKEEIVEYYLNTIYLGRGAYGIMAASEEYFNKSLNELTVSEIAAMAGITQNPVQYDPVAYPDESAERRQLVLKKMLELDYITQAEYDTACADDVYARIKEQNKIQSENQTTTTYYQDEIFKSLRDDFMELYGCTRDEAEIMIYTGGYTIYSAQDKDIQNICDTVINDTSYLSSSDKVGLSYELTLADDNGEEHNYGINDLIAYFKSVTGNTKYNQIYANKDEAKAAAEQFKEAKLDETGYTYIAENFSVSPQPQFSFTIMDQKTGYIKAIVGGRGTKTSALTMDRATMSARQPGSTYKIVAAYLPLIDTGLGCLASSFKDEPTTYENGAPLQNWNGVYKGYCSVREAIQNSMNILAVKAITKVTPEVAYDYLIQLGFEHLVDNEVSDTGVVLTDKTQSAALGGLTNGVTTYEMTAAYACIANGGLYTEPVYYTQVLDHDGNIVIDNTTPTTRRVIKETTAFQLIEAMKSVVNSGTGTPAKLRSGVTCAGKTGTTSQHYDLWFCGMTPYYTASIWMGYDSNVSMSDGTTHKYMWRDIMDQIAALEGQDTSVDFERPEGITSISLCQITGKLPIDGCPTFTDYCASDFSPGTCTGHETIEICMESRLRATSNCPTKQTYAVEVDEETGAKTLADAEDGIVYTDEVCPLHPENTGHTITSSAGAGGSITPSQTVDSGGTITFYITPLTGYAISDVVVNGASVGPVTSYTFTDVQADATISASFVATGVTPSPDPGTTAVPSTDTTTAVP